MPHLELTDQEIERIADAVAARLQPAAVRDDSELLNEKQVAAMTGLSVRTLQKRRKQKAAPHCVRIGRAVRYRRDDVLAAIVSSEP